MMRSRRQAENGLISGYKKAEKVARKKVVTEVSGFSVPRCRFASNGIFDRFQFSGQMKVSVFRFQLLCFFPDI